MKYLVTAKPGPMPPPIEVLRGAQEWFQAKLDDGSFEVVYGYPQGGGCSIGENESVEELMEQLLFDVQPPAGLNAAFDRFIPFVEKASAQLAGQGSS